MRSKRALSASVSVVAASTCPQCASIHDDARPITLVSSWSLTADVPPPTRSSTSTAVGACLNSAIVRYGVENRGEIVVIALAIPYAFPTTSGASLKPHMKPASSTHKTTTTSSPAHTSLSKTRLLQRLRVSSRLYVNRSILRPAIRLTTTETSALNRDLAHRVVRSNHAFHTTVLSEKT